MSVTLCDKRPSYFTVKNWVATFITRHLSTEDKEHSGRPTPKNAMPFIPWSWTTEEYPLKSYVAEILAISRERVSYIIHEILYTRKLSAKLVPKCLSPDQKRVRVLVHKRWDPVGFLNRLVTMDETWIHVYDPETKEHSKEWRHSGSPRPSRHRSHQPRCWRLSSGTKM
jgi:hypothetical protein